MNLSLKQEQIARILVLAFFALMLSASIILAQSMTSKISGKVVDGTETMPQIRVLLKKNGIAIFQTQTDSDGNYSFSNLENGEYEVVAVVASLEKGNQEATVFSGKSTSVTLNIADVHIGPTEIWGKVDNKPNFDIDITIVGPTLSRIEIRQSPIRDIKDFVVAIGGADRNPKTGELFMRGGRSNATQFIIDGQKIQGEPSVPKAMMSEIQVINGGIPAQFGDCIGGVIVVSTANDGMFPLMATEGEIARWREKQDRKAVKALRKKEKDKAIDGDDSGLWPLGHSTMVACY